MNYKRRSNYEEYHDIIEYNSSRNLQVNLGLNFKELIKLLKAFFLKIKIALIIN